MDLLVQLSIEKTWLTIVLEGELMDERRSSDSITELMEAHNLNFNPAKERTCPTCAHDPTYEELRKGIVCRADEDCVDEKQWKPRLYINDWYVRNKEGYSGKDKDE